MSLLNNLKKFLYGVPGMEYGRENLGQMEGSQGLIGTGGEFGGGLLQNNFSKINKGEGLLNNIPENVMLGAALYGQGLKGKDPLEGFFPAITQSAQLKNLLSPKTELQKNLEAAGYKVGTPEYRAALNAYLNKGKQNTLSKEALALYKEGQVAPDFDKWFEGLNKVEKDLYNKQIKPVLSGQELAFEFIEKTEKNLLKDAIPVPIKNNQVDTSALIKGGRYNIQNQLFVWDGKEMVAYKEYIKR